MALAGAATGVVLSLQTRDSLIHFGAKSMLPAIIAYSVIKESGPVITGLIVSGRVGAGIGAELGSMRVTEQIDAMEVSAVDPFRFLVATRVLACVLMMPLLTLCADACAIVSLSLIHILHRRSSASSKGSIVIAIQEPVLDSPFASELSRSTAAASGWSRLPGAGPGSVSRCRKDRP